MPFPPNKGMMPLTGLGGPPAGPAVPKAPIPSFASKFGKKKKPTNKANKFARALTRAPKAIATDMTTQY